MLGIKLAGTRLLYATASSGASTIVYQTYSSTFRMSSYLRLMAEAVAKASAPHVFATVSEAGAEVMVQDTKVSARLGKDRVDI